MKVHFESLEVLKRVSDREQTALTEAARKYKENKMTKTNLLPDEIWLSEYDTCVAFDREDDCRSIGHTHRPYKYIRADLVSTTTSTRANERGDNPERHEWKNEVCAKCGEDVFIAGPVCSGPQKPITNHGGNGKPLAGTPQPAPQSTEGQIGYEPRSVRLARESQPTGKGGDGLSRALNHIENLIAEFADYPENALECIGEYIGMIQHAKDQQKTAEPEGKPDWQYWSKRFFKNGIAAHERVVCVDVPHVYGTVVYCDDKDVIVRWDDGTIGELVWDETVAYNAYRLQVITTHLQTLTADNAKRGDLVSALRAVDDAIDDKGYFENADGDRYQIMSAKQARTIKALTTNAAISAPMGDMAEALAAVDWLEDVLQSCSDTEGEQNEKCRIIRAALSHDKAGLGVDVPALKAAVKEEIGCLVYDTMHSMSQPSMQGKTYGELMEYQKLHINKAVADRIDRLMGGEGK